MSACTYYWCFNNFSAYIWLNFQPAKEGAGNSSWKYVNESRRTCRVADCVYKNYKRMWLETGNMTPFALLPAKNRLPKQDTVFLRRNCLSNGCRTCMLLRKRFAVSPRNLSCQKFILLVKSNWPGAQNWLILFCGFRDGNEKNCRDQSRLIISSRSFATQFRAAALAFTPTWTCYQATER